MSADSRALDLALFILSPDGQRILSQFGFAPVGLPALEVISQLDVMP